MQRLEEAAGQQVQFRLSADELAFYTAKGMWQAETGAFEVFVGGDSVHVKSARFELR